MKLDFIYGSVVAFFIRTNMLPMATWSRNISLAPFRGDQWFESCQGQGGCVSVFNYQKQKIRTKMLNIHS